MNRERIPPEEAEVIRRWLPRLAPLTVDHPEAPLASPEWRAGFKAATQRIGERLNRLTAPPPIGVTEGWCWRTAGDPSRVAADSHGPPEWGHATPCWIVPKDLTNRMQGMDGVWVLVFDEPTDAEP